jgi:dihydropyrimidinase
MTRRLLIRGGEVTTAVDCWTGDILIEDGRIVALGAALSADAEIHEAAGLLVLPGGVDVHTHIDYDTGTARTADTFETATRAAAFGGTTTVVDFAFQPRHSPSVAAALDDWLARAATACIDVGAHMTLTTVTEATLAETRELVRYGGVTSVKLFMAYPDTLMVDDGAILRGHAAGRRGWRLGLLPRRERSGHQGAGRGGAGGRTYGAAISRLDSPKPDGRRGDASRDRYRRIVERAGLSGPPFHARGNGGGDPGA